MKLLLIQERFSWIVTVYVVMPFTSPPVTMISFHTILNTGACTPTTHEMSEVVTEKLAPDTGFCKYDEIFASITVGVLPLVSVIVLFGKVIQDDGAATTFTVLVVVPILPAVSD